MNRFANLQANAQKTLAPLLFLTVTFMTYFMATVQSPLVPLEVPFGFAKVLPIQYWALLFFTLLLLAVSVASRRLPYLWVSAVILTVIVAGLRDLIVSYPHDIFATVATEYISTSGVFNPAQHIFLNFPGSEIIFSAIAIVTKADPIAVIRAYGVLYNPLLLGLSYVSFRRFGVSQIAGVLGGLTLVLGFYTQGLLIYSSLNGFLFYVLIVGFILAPSANRSANMILVTMFFIAMVVTHAFSPFLTTAGIVGVLAGGAIMTKIKGRGHSRTGSHSEDVSLLIPILFLVLTALYWAYAAFTPFSYGLFLASSTCPTCIIQEVFSPLVSPSTVYEMSYAGIARLYAPILFLAFATYVVFTPNDRGRKVKLIFLMLGLGGASAIAVSGYANEFLTRGFAFALFPLCYGVSRLFNSNRRTFNALAVIALLLVLGLHIPAHYGQDAFLDYPTSTVNGVRFVAQHSHPNSTFDSTTREFAWHYYFDLYRSNLSDNETGTYYFILSYPAATFELYTKGQIDYTQLITKLNSGAYNVIYSNGLFTVYS